MVVGLWPQPFSCGRITQRDRSCVWASSQLLSTTGTAQHNSAVMLSTLDLLKHERCTSGWPVRKLPWPNWQNAVIGAKWLRPGSWHCKFRKIRKSQTERAEGAGVAAYRVVCMLAQNKRQRVVARTAPSRFDTETIAKAFASHYDCPMVKFG